MHRGDDQLLAGMRNALTTGNQPGTERLGYGCIKYTGRANMEQPTVSNSPKRLYLAAI